MTRREMLATAGTTLAWLSASRLGGQGGSDAQGLPMLKNMGGEGPGFANRNRAGGFDIEIVHTTKLKQPLTSTAGLSPAQALKLEDDLIDRSIAYARKNLSL